MPARKYEKIIKLCPICHASFETLKNFRDEKTYCSILCSNKSRKPSLAAKKKISKTLILRKTLLDKNFESKYNLETLKLKTHKCERCNKEFERYNKKLKYCSRQCAFQSREPTSQETKDKIRKAHIIRLENGQHEGWKSSNRKNKSPSYPESYIIKLLDDLQVKYEREVQVGRYFIDFAIIFPGITKIAVEIDGKQHSYPERIKSDIAKDKLLIGNGWHVFRIKWHRVSLDYRRFLYYIFTKILDIPLTKEQIENKILINQTK